MKTIKFKAYFEPYRGSKETSELEIEVEDDADDSEIEEAKSDAAREWANNLYSLSYD